jgi:putative transcriptional regulator
MQIVVTLDMMLAKRKMTLTELSDKVGIALNNLSALKTGRARGLRFATLSKICQVLDCKPGDLLDAVSDEAYIKLFGALPEPLTE